MDGGDLERTARDVELFGRIYRYLRLKPNSSFQEIATYIGGGLNPQKISAFIERLEGQIGGIRLIERRQKSKNNILTHAADEVYKGLDALESLRNWPTKPERDLVRIGAPNLLITSVLPKIIPTYRKSLRGADVPVDIRIDEHPEIDVVIENVVKGDWDFALVWIHKDKLRHNTYLKTEKNIVLEENCFGIDFDILMICPPGHQFVDEARSGSEGGRYDLPWALDLKRTADQLVYVLPAQRQPLYSLLPHPADPKKRVVQGTYMAIISMVRCHLSEGIGFVPSLYSELNEMRRKGQLFYAPVRDEGVPDERLKITVGCISRKGIKNLKPSAQKFFEVAGPKFREITALNYDPDNVRALPESLADYTEYRYCAFVMQDSELFGVPEWFRGELRWGHSSNNLNMIIGQFIATTTRRSWAFDIEGHLEKGGVARNRIFYVKGKGQAHDNSIICSFNIGALADHPPKREAIVGVWSGRDDRGLATVAPMVLSRAPLSIESVRSTVNKVSFRCLPNAETEYTGAATEG